MKNKITPIVKSEYHFQGTLSSSHESKFMRVIECKWVEFGSITKKLIEENTVRSSNLGETLKGLWFRGQSNAKWDLFTTLERHTKQKMGVTTYNSVVVTIGSLITSLTPDLPVFEKNVIVSTPESIHYRTFPNIELAVYLRHHGFPSPLLDWSESPYVAAFFAFNNIPKDSSHVSIIVLEHPRVKNGELGFGLHEVGRYIAGGKRHSYQQARYTWCSKVEDGICFFDSHHNQHKKLLTKIVLPVSDAKEALADLSLMNINEYSMLGTTDALIKSNLSILEDYGFKKSESD
jgi:hypothetical protein